MKTVWEDVWLEVEADDEETARTRALKRAPDDEDLEWARRATTDYDAIDLVELPKQAAE